MQSTANPSPSHPPPASTPSRRLSPRPTAPWARALNKELLAEKEKINCVWLYMTAREYAQLRQMGAGKNFFRLNYYDATTMTKKTKEFYGSDVTATELNGLDRNDIPQGYQTVKWSFIER